MLQMVEQDDVTVLMQLPARPMQRRPPREDKWRTRAASMDGGDDDLSFMQTTVDRFGVILQKLLGLLEKMGQPRATARASFMLSMLADVQRPGAHITSAVIERVDRLQALLLSFQEGADREVTEEDREWCFSQWGVVRPVLLDKKREGGPGGRREQASSSSEEIVCLEDSQEDAEGCGSQVAVLANGTTRQLTLEEKEEIAFHDQLEQDAAEREAQADMHRWLEYRAQCLQEEENQTMRDAMAESADQTDDTQKKARVLIQVEGEGGRIVKSEIYNLVVRDGETLTYKIGVLPCNDPEVRRLRRQQAVRQERQLRSRTARSAVPAPRRCQLTAVAESFRYLLWCQTMSWTPS